jgi:glycosyltransferase involved in cell wall biosynthesis
LQFILDKAAEYGLAEQLKYLGFVDGAEIPALYQQSLALVMPTYFGPTNLPPLEAFALGVPVLYSDLPGLREQVEGAALLLDLRDPESLAKNLLKVINKDKEVIENVQKGKQKLLSWSEADYWQGLQQIFADFELSLKCWKA